MTGKSVTCTGACANEIISNRLIARLSTKRKKDGMLEFYIYITCLIKREAVYENRKLHQTRLYK